jgi:tetratricopeptide (TPR) repeat protein
MRFWLSMLCFMIDLSVCAQTGQQSVAKGKEDRLATVDRLLKLSEEQAELAQGIQLLDSAAFLASQSKMPLKAAEAVWRKGNLCLRQYEDTAADQYFVQAAAMYEQLQDSKGIALCSRGRARVLQLRGFYLPAISYDIKARKLFQSLGDPEEEARSFNDIGVCYYLQGDYPQAINQYLSSLKLYQQTKNVRGQIMTEGNIVRVYHKTKAYEKAKVLIEKNFPVYESLGDSNGLAQAYMQMGINNDLRLKGDSALRWYEKSKNIFEKKGNLSGTAQSLTNMAIVLSDSGRYSEAFEQYKTALQLFKKLNYESNILSVQFNMAELYLAAPDSFYVNQHIPLSNRMSLAKDLYQDNISRASDGGDMEAEQLAWAGLSGLYKAQGDYRQAYFARVQSDSLKEKILNEGNIAEIAQQVAKFEYEKQEAVLMTKQEAALARKQFEKNVVLGGSGLALMAGLFSFLVYRRKRNAVARQKEAELQFEVTNMEMKALRAQMNPHFMFNSLNAIGDFMSRNETNIANEYLVSFASLMRLVLENSEKKSVCLTDDLKALDLYMKLESLRTNHKFSYSIQVDPTLDPDNTFVPPLLLQPFVENSIWHGIAHKQGEGQIQVKIEKDGQMIRCVVEDDGVGRARSEAMKPRADAPARKSLGMQITAARIELLNKTRNAAAGMMFSDLAAGTRVEMRLPLETD